MCIRDRPQGAPGEVRVGKNELVAMAHAMERGEEVRSDGGMNSSKHDPPRLHEGAGAPLGGTLRRLENEAECGLTSGSDVGGGHQPLADEVVEDLVG